MTAPMVKKTTRARTMRTSVGLSLLIHSSGLRGVLSSSSTAVEDKKAIVNVLALVDVAQKCESRLLELSAPSTRSRIGSNCRDY